MTLDGMPLNYHCLKPISSPSSQTYSTLDCLSGLYIQGGADVGLQL